jgi:hypothetical protein
MSMRVLKCRQRRRREFALSGSRRLPQLIGSVGLVVFSFQLLPQQVQEELLKRLGAQAASIVLG